MDKKTGNDLNMEIISHNPIPEWTVKEIISSVKLIDDK